MKKQRYNPLTGRVDFYFEPVQGPKGDKGEKGDKGDAVIGPTGPAGLIGPIGPTGPMGLPGRDGKDGLSIKGDTGPAGKNGRDGRDGKDGINQNPNKILHRSLKIPTNDLGQDGDWCFNEMGELFFKRNNKWEFFVQITGNNPKFTYQGLGGGSSLPYDTTPSSESVSYLSNGEIDLVTFYNSLTQVTANRTAQVQLNYNVSLDPSTEVWTFYQADGSTVITNVTFTFTYTGSEITNTEVTIT